MEFLEAAVPRLLDLNAVAILHKNNTCSTFHHELFTLQIMSLSKWTHVKDRQRNCPGDSSTLCLGMDFLVLQVVFLVLGIEILALHDVILSENDGNQTTARGISIILGARLGDDAVTTLRDHTLLALLGHLRFGPKFGIRVQAIKGDAKRTIVFAQLGYRDESFRAFLELHQELHARALTLAPSSRHCSNLLSDVESSAFVDFEKTIRFGLFFERRLLVLTVLQKRAELLVGRLRKEFRGSGNHRLDLELQSELLGFLFVLLGMKFLAFLGTQLLDLVVVHIVEMGVFGSTGLEVQRSRSVRGEIVVVFDLVLGHLSVILVVAVIGEWIASIRDAHILEIRAENRCWDLALGGLDNKQDSRVTR